MRNFTIAGENDSFKILFAECLNSVNLLTFLREKFQLILLWSLLLRHQSSIRLRQINLGYDKILAPLIVTFMHTRTRDFEKTTGTQKCYVPKFMLAAGTH